VDNQLYNTPHSVVFSTIRPNPDQPFLQLSVSLTDSSPRHTALVEYFGLLLQEMDLRVDAAFLLKVSQLNLPFFFFFLITFLFLGSQRVGACDHIDHGRRFDSVVTARQTLELVESYNELLFPGEEEAEQADTFRVHLQAEAEAQARMLYFKVLHLNPMKIRISYTSVSAVESNLYLVSSFILVFFFFFDCFLFVDRSNVAIPLQTYAIL
jgi:hypothetical protein